MTKPLYLVQQAFTAMGSPCEIQIYLDSKKRARYLIGRAITEVARLEAKYSRYRSDSFLSEINRIALQGGSISVDSETSGLFDYVATCYQQSDGLFDVTSGVLRKAWSFSENQLPSPAQIEPLLEKVGWNKVLWQPPVLSFPLKGVEIDLGGAVKEYAVDRISVLLWQAGIRHGLVNLGGDIKIIGPHPDQSGWNVAIAHPFEAGSTIRQLHVKKGAIASSGDYERCIVVDDVRYSHVLDPRTGWPVGYLSAVSVVAEFCVVAGSASTIAMLKGVGGPQWLESLGLRYFWVDVQGNTGGNLLA